MKAKILKALTTSQIVLSVFSGIIGALIASLPAYVGIYYMNASLDAQRDQIEIMQESLEREAKLIMTVIPSSDFKTERHKNGTVTIGTDTLTLSRAQDCEFRMYVSNVGDAFAHLLCYCVNMNSDSNYTLDSFFSTDTLVLEPHESTNFTYKFDPMGIPSDFLQITHNLEFTFTIVAAETSISKVILADFSDFP